MNERVSVKDTVKGVGIHARNAFWQGFFTFLMFAQALVPIYLIDIRLVMFLLASLVKKGAIGGGETENSAKVALGNSGFGITIVVLCSVSLLCWLSLLAYCLWSTYWVGYRWKPISALLSPLK